MVDLCYSTFLGLCAMQKNKAVTLIHFETISSTSVWVKENASTLDPKKITCVTASEQTHGRNAKGQKWLSPKGTNLYGTFFFSLPKMFPFLHNLAQILSISCCKVVESEGLSPNLKWPNDLLIENKKVSGVLCETIDLQDRTGIALGIGLNINMEKELTDRIDQPATSLAQIARKPFSVEDITKKLIKQFALDLSVFELEGFAPFVSYYNEHMLFKGALLFTTVGNENITGVCRGVSKEGRIILLLPSGEETSFATGSMKLVSS